ncbi:MAG: exodeoxyribonuclease VII large subunit [Chloroflexota bacterium]|nr:exodeoxyribonuclease VII large subunit [Chloroflexota bacterium]
MTSHILPVSMLNAYIQQVVAADDILADIWIEGEISQLTRARSGHIYFKLCESDALIDCAMWKHSVARQAFIPRVGDEVIIHGHADFYAPQGRLQIIADIFEHQGQGILALEMELLRQRLEAEGLFDLARKRELPPFPRRVGVVTSSAGAVWHDIQTVTRRRFPLVELVLISASVQGSNAPREIVAAIRRMCELDNIDVMIVGRGGGSPEDLACFNSEEVARAIFASTVPVVSAVGHETDVSIADMVADVRAATPSAAAEIILPDIRELAVLLEDSREALIELAERRLADERSRLDALTRRFHQQSPLAHVSRAEQELGAIGRRLRLSGRSYLQQRQMSLRSTAKVLAALDPTRVLERGYAVVETPSPRAPIRRLADLDGDTAVVVNFRDGTARGTIAPHPGSSREDTQRS